MVTVLTIFCTFFKFHAQEVLAGPAPIQRVFKKHQSDRYAVSVDSVGSNGKVHYEYQIRFLADHVVPKSTDTHVIVTFLDLHATYDGTEAPFKKTFGVAGYQFPVVGFPSDYSLGGAETVLVAPILSWYLPTSPTGPDSHFGVPEMIFDNNIHVTGVGSLQRSETNDSIVKVDLLLSGGEKGRPSANGYSSFKSSATFNPKTGVLIVADGKMTGASGSMSFHLKKI